MMVVRKKGEGTTEGHFSEFQLVNITIHMDAVRCLNTMY